MENAKILATVGGKPITDNEVDAFLLRMGQRGQSYNTPEGRAMILEQLIAQQLLLVDANINMIEREPAFKEQMRRVREELLINYAMQKVMDSVRVSDDDVKAYYEEHKEEMVSGKTFNASHILVADKALAEELLAKIRAGALDFAAAAAEHSTCPSGKEGGNLGDFGHGQMVPEFENACDAMEVGEISEPVQTQFGWHLIKLNSKSDGAVVSFEDAKEQIAAALKSEKQEAAYRSKINQLKILYPVEKA